MKFEFKLIYRLDPVEDDYGEVIERLGEAGCTDALIGIGAPGRIGLDFTREAKNAKEAFLSAMSAVKRAIPSARLIEVGTDLVGLTEVANRLSL